MRSGRVVWVLSFLVLSAHFCGSSLPEDLGFEVGPRGCYLLPCVPTAAVPALA